MKNFIKLGAAALYCTAGIFIGANCNSKFEIFAIISFTIILYFLLQIKEKLKV
jgi:uncharacterized membrane protein YhiD involved in acid resistance